MNFKEYIDKDIEEKKVLLDLLPMNTEARVKKYKDTIDGIVDTYQSLIDSTRTFIDYKYEKLRPHRIDKIPTINSYNDQIVGLKEIINLTNPTTGFYEKLGFDMLLFELEHYYDYSLQENNEIIRKIISKFTIAGIKISADDFKINVFTYNYMLNLFELFNGKEIDIEILKKLFWKCPKMYENIIVSIKILIDKNIKKFKSFISSYEKKVLNENGFENRDKVLERLFEVEAEKEKVEDKDEADIITDFMDGNLDFGVYENTMNNLYGELDYFLIKPINTEDINILNQTVNRIDTFYNNLLEYQGYSVNDPLFENIKNTFNKNISSLDEKQMIKDFKAHDKKISKMNSKVKKGFINKILTLDNIENSLTTVDINSIIEQQKNLTEIYSEYLERNKMYYNLKLKQKIQPNSFISSIIELIVFYPYFSRSIIKSVFEYENATEVTDKYNEIYDLLYNRNRKLIDMKSIFSNENFELRLMDAYRFDNLNVNETTFEEDNQQLVFSNYEKLKNKMKISKFQHTIDEISFLINIKKMKDEEVKD